MVASAGDIGRTADQQQTAKAVVRPLDEEQILELVSSERGPVRSWELGPVCAYRIVHRSTALWAVTNDQRARLLELYEQQTL